MERPNQGDSILHGVRHSGRDDARRVDVTHEDGHRDTSGYSDDSDEPPKSTPPETTPRR